MILISAEFEPSTFAQRILFIFYALPLEAALVNAAARVAVTAYLAVFPVIVVGLFKFGADMILLQCWI